MSQTLYFWANQNVIEIGQGSDYEDVVEVKHEDETGPAYDLTGCTVLSQLRTLAGVLVLEFECTVDEVNGLINRKIPAAQTTTLTAGKNINYVWGVKVTDAQGNVLRQGKGGARVEPEPVKEETE